MFVYKCLLSNNWRDFPTSQICTSRGEDQLELRYRPGDPFEHPLRSSASKTQNILLEVKLPKKFLDQANGDIQKAIQLSKGKYTAKPKYIIETNYRFREMSDFQFLTRGSSFAQKMKDSIFSGNIQNIKTLTLDMNEPFSSKEDLDMLPPPKFAPVTLPFNYGYRQNVGVTVVEDGKGGSKLVNTKTGPKLYSITISADDPSPTGPLKELEGPPDKPTQECLDVLTKLFDERPIWSRRALEYHVPAHLQKSIKSTLPRISYSFRGGPWRSTAVKFGVDPRSSPEYRFYQTRYFRNISSEKNYDSKRTRRNG